MYAFLIDLYHKIYYIQRHFIIALTGNTLLQRSINMNNKLFKAFIK